jgi:mycothiol synthase
MIWPANLEVPEYTIPDGYELRPLKDGDEDGHVAVMNEAGFSTWGKKNLKMWHDTYALPDGIFVIEYKKDNSIVATAMANHKPTELHPGAGELGWVAASKDHAGKGLGMAVCYAVVQRYLDAGYKDIFLNTDDNRLAAIKTYLKMGFVPFVYTNTMEERWRSVCEKLKWESDPDAWVYAAQELMIEEPADERPDSDSVSRVSRYAVRHKWHPQRPHRGYSCNGDVDAFGDESLYKPSQFGAASVKPENITAGAKSYLTLTFTAGICGDRLLLGKFPNYRRHTPTHVKLKLKVMVFM